MNNIFFLKCFTINYVPRFLFYITFKWKILQWKIHLYGNYMIIKKTKQMWKYYEFVRAINCTAKLTCVCAWTCTCDHMCLMEQCVTQSCPFDVKYKKPKSNLSLWKCIFKGCNCYIFASLFFKFKRKHLSWEKYFLFHF